MRHGAHVHALLHTGGGQLCPAGLTAGHHIGVIAEDGDRMRSDRAGGNVHDRRQLQARDAVHRRDHQHQALGRGIGGAERAGFQHALQGAAGTCLGLHLNQSDLRTENILQPVSRPLIHMGGHGTGWGDGIDGGRLRKGIGDIRGGLIAVHGFKHFFAGQGNHPPLSYFLAPIHIVLQFTALSNGIIGKPYKIENLLNKRREDERKKRSENGMALSDRRKQDEFDA